MPILNEAAKTLAGEADVKVAVNGYTDGNTYGYTDGYTDGYSFCNATGYTDSYTDGKFKSCELDITYPVVWGKEAIEARLASLAAQAEDGRVAAGKVQVGCPLFFHHIE